ncbi:hypothetical protein Ancab_030359 [Ancistrocladus abbreviatus]
MKHMEGPKLECVMVQNKFSLGEDRVITAYEVRDEPSVLMAEDWDRVRCGCFCFSYWFLHAFEDDSVEPAKIVKQWNIKIISALSNSRARVLLMLTLSEEPPPFRTSHKHFGCERTTLASCVQDPELGAEKLRVM